LTTLTEIFFNDIPVATLANPKIAARDAKDTPTGNPTPVSAVPVRSVGHSSIQFSFKIKNLKWISIFGFRGFFIVKS